MFGLAKYLKPYWMASLLAPLLMLVEVFADLLQPRLMAGIIDHGIMAGDVSHIQISGLQMLGFALLGLVGGAGCTVFASIASQRFGADIRQELFAKIQTFSFRNLDRLQTGSLITRMTNDVTQVQMFVHMLLRVMVRGPFLAIGSFIMAFLIHPRLALILLLVMPILFAALYLVIRKGFPLFSQVQQKLDKVNTVLRENLAGIRVVKAFVRSGYETERFRATNDDYRSVAVRASIVMATMMPVMFFLLNGSILIVLWLGGQYVWNGSLQIGSLVAFINYMIQLLFNLMMVGMMLVNISRAKASADRIVEVLHTVPDIQETVNPRDRAIHSGRIEFDNVSFAYEGEDWVLRHIHFAAEPGQTVAILGATGSGKTSLVNLIPRLYEATEGSVRIDGVDVRQISLHHLRSRIGIILQEAILFSGTIRDNIRYGSPDADHADVEAAARAAQAHDFIMRMPEGYDSIIGQRGVDLSGGQKQRISIARALLTNPAILIMDDSTSAIDLGTESRIQQALKELMQRSTNLIIAQRISSVVDADKIIVLDEGWIVAEGTHEQLLATSVVYQDIYRSQRREEDVIHV